MNLYGTIGANWNDIWDKVDKPNYCDYCELNRRICNEVKKKSYAILDACVEYAMSTGNHTAFVHFFMSEAKAQKKIFFDVLCEYINEYKEKRGRIRNGMNLKY